MTRREAKRIALLIMYAELSGSLLISDEWARDPETDELFTNSDIRKIKAEAQKLVEGLEARALRLENQAPKKNG